MSTFTEKSGLHDAVVTPPATLSGRERTLRSRGVELAVVVLILSPSALSFVPSTLAGRVGFDLSAVSTMLRDAGLIGLVALLVWQGGEPLSALGWRWRHPLREVALGVVAFPLGFLVVRWLDATLQQLGVPGPAAPVTFLRPPSSVGALALATVLVGVVAFAEETVFRGYLMLRFGQVTGSVLAAVGGSSVVFALGHGYEGLSGAVSVGVLGALLAALYRWRGSLIAPITVHFLQDFTVLVAFTVLHH